MRSAELAPTAPKFRAASSGVAHVGHRLAAEVGTAQVGQHLGRRNGRAVEPATGLHLHEGGVVLEARRVGAAQLHLHVGIDDAGRKRRDFGAVDPQRFFERLRPFEPVEDDYLAYTYNRFQACRFGLDGEVVDPLTAEHRPQRELIAQTIEDVEMHAIELRAERGLNLLRRALATPDGSDATWLRNAQTRAQYLPEVVRQQCLRFEGAGPALGSAARAQAP